MCGHRELCKQAESGHITPREETRRGQKCLPLPTEGAVELDVCSTVFSLISMQGAPNPAVFSSNIKTTVRRLSVGLLFPFLHFLFSTLAGCLPTLLYSMTVASFLYIPLSLGAECLVSTNLALKKNLKELQKMASSC